MGVNIYFRLSKDQKGTDIITEGRLAVGDDDQNAQQEISFGDVGLNKGETYYFLYTLQNSSQFSLSNVTLQNVDRNFTLPINFKPFPKSRGRYKVRYRLHRKNR